MVTTKPRIAIIVDSTRPTRFADGPAQWMLKRAQARDDMAVELIDLRDHPLPFLDEEASSLRMPSKNPEAIRWRRTVARFDGCIFVVAEYNRSITGVLKNALDEAYNEWGAQAVRGDRLWRRRRRSRDRAPARGRLRVADGSGPHQRRYRRARLHGGCIGVRETSRSSPSMTTFSRPPSPCSTS